MEINASGNIIDGGYTGELSATSFSGDGSSLTNLVGLPTSLAFSNDGVLSLGRSGGQPNLTIDIDLGQTDSPSFTGLTVTNTISGNIDSADKWKTTRTLALTGDVSGSQSIDGSGNVSLAVTVIDDSHNHVVGNIDSFTENVQDIVGGMVSGNTESGIIVVYQDSDGTIDFDVNDPTITLTGAVTGSAQMTNLGNVSITTSSSPVLTLTGDATGSATFTNLGNASLTVTVIDDSHNHVISNVDGLQAALDAKTTPGYVDTQVSALVDSAPGTLDTLNELAAALGDDPNHATTMTTLIGTKLSLSGGAMTGAITTNSTFAGRDVAADGTKLDGIATGATNYSHPSHPGDDFSVDTGALSGAVIVSDIDINVTTDSLGHVTDANGSVATRTLTLANLGYTGATNANYITNNNQLTNGAGYVTSSGNTIIGTDSDIDTSGANVIDTLVMTDGVITSHSTRALTLGDLGYTGATNANYITNNNQLTNGAGYYVFTPATGSTGNYSTTWSSTLNYGASTTLSFNIGTLIENSGGFRTLSFNWNSWSHSFSGQNAQHGNASPTGVVVSDLKVLINSNWFYVADLRGLSLDDTAPALMSFPTGGKSVTQISLKLTNVTNVNQGTTTNYVVNATVGIV